MDFVSIKIENGNLSTESPNQCPAIPQIGIFGENIG
jgi:hypothetical protein